MIGVEGEFLEDLGIGGEGDEGAVGFIGFAFFFPDEIPGLEFGFNKFAVAVGADEKVSREGVDGFGTYTVETNAELEDIVVIFGTGVNFGDTVDNFSEWNTASEVADGNSVVFDANVNALAVAHDKFVDPVIDYFFHEDVDAIVVVGAGTGTPDIHAGTEADVFEGGEGFDFIFGVGLLLFLRHVLGFSLIETVAQLGFTRYVFRRMPSRRSRFFLCWAQVFGVL